MGSNGKRSGACHTCRKRRVKCDLTEPVCQRCTKAKIQCDGYVEKGGLKFVDEKEKAEKRVQIKREAYLQAIHAEDEKVKAQKEIKETQSSKTHSAEQSPKPTYAVVASPKSKSRGNNTQSTFGRELSLVGFQDNVHMSFLISKFLVGARMFTPWMLTGCKWTENCTTTQTMKALSGLYFGRINRRKKSLDYGFQCYSKALRLLSTDLVSKKAWELPSLTNALSLTVFETMASPTGMGFLQHEGGVARLVQSSNPERFQSIPELAVFDTARLAIVFGCADLRIRCFLEEPRWKTIPWLKHPETKDLISLIYDRFCDFPGILADLEAFRTGQLRDPVEVTALYQAVCDQLRRLYEWRAQWEFENAQCCSTKSSQDPESPFPHAFHFKNLLQAAGLAHYNTVLLVLLRAGRMLKGPDFSFTTSSDSIPVTRTNPNLLLPQDPKTLHGVASEILRSVEYSISEPHVSGGCFRLLFSLRAALEVYRPGCPERDYLMKTFSDIADKGGFEMSRGLTSAGICGRMIEDEHLII
ncbi:hypothetical protein BKA65DRAFT_545159 [Rhexocercosporidium sp. MPI-PUGE-AT-0058]|nr:hypothetical protein BKA65DRAFT_545159 [Rhexocercosporidium sp. MPI-PUGE-AT-0058]